MKGLGYSKIVLKSDQEAPLKQLEDKISEETREYMKKMIDSIGTEMACQVVQQHSLVGESAANGVIENAIQRAQGQMRAIKFDLEGNTKDKIKPSSPLWPWMI